LPKVRQRFSAEYLVILAQLLFAVVLVGLAVLHNIVLVASRWAPEELRGYPSSLR
jgi:hypothetical protein